MTDDKRLRSLAAALFIFGLVAGILAVARLPNSTGLATILIYPPIALALCQAFLLALWGLSWTAYSWQRITGLVAGTAYLETLLVLSVDRTLGGVATVTVVVTTACLLVLRVKGVRLIRHLAIDLSARANAPRLRFSIRSLMLLTAAVALLSALARALRAMPVPDNTLLVNFFSFPCAS